MPFEFCSDSVSMEKTIISQAQKYVSELAEYAVRGSFPYDKLEKSYFRAKAITDLARLEKNGLSEYAEFKLHQIEEECNYLWTSITRTHKKNEWIRKIPRAG